MATGQRGTKHDGGACPFQYPHYLIWYTRCLGYPHSCLGFGFGARRATCKSAGMPPPPLPPNGPGKFAPAFRFGEGQRCGEGVRRSDMVYLRTRQEDVLCTYDLTWMGGPRFLMHRYQNHHTIHTHTHEPHKRIPPSWPC